MAHGSGPDDAADLLLRALDGLEPAERETVLRALLTGSIASTGALAAGLYGLHPPSVGATFSQPIEVRLGRAATSQSNQPLVIRLPTDLHARFRRWSTNNGFTMAAVARGLIERFLEGRA